MEMSTKNSHRVIRKLTLKEGEEKRVEEREKIRARERVRKRELGREVNIR
tara:strand:+ start:606 stop:755 length:150 start_codon:yes stop_codon:yes gene_type:complete